MAVNRNFYLNNNLVEPPKNAPETTIELNFEKGSATPTKTLSITDYDWRRKNADIILKHYQDGKIFEGLPFRYELERQGEIEKIFNGYLDLTANPKLSCEEGSQVTAKEIANVDWLNDVADSVSFAYLDSIGKIPSSLVLFQPYVINSIPNYTQAFICLVSIAVISIQIAEQIEDLIELTASVANPLELSAIVRIIARVLYIIGLLLTLVLLIKDMVQLIIQPVKYHACMKTKDLLRIGAEHFGFNLIAPMFDSAPLNNKVYMPEKYNNPAAASDYRILGFLSPDPILQRGYPSGTFGDFLRELQKEYRAKVVIDSDKNLYFVPQTYNVTAPQYQLPDLYQPVFSTNAHELKSNYLIEYATDLSDKNTIQEYKGTSFQVITSANPAPSDVHLNLIKDIEQVPISWARASRKTELTVPEKIVKVFLDAFSGMVNGLIAVANVVIDAVNAIIDLVNDVLDALSWVGIDLDWELNEVPRIKYIDAGASIENRIGMLQIETDFLTVPKVFIMAPGSQSKYNKIADNNSEIISGRYLWENFHRDSVSFLPSANKPNGCQFLIKEFDKVSFCFKDYQKIKNNSAIFTFNGQNAFIETLEWNDFDETAKMKIRISYLYTDKLKETYIEPDGR